MKLSNVRGGAQSSIPLVYILSTGRSGSTLLDLLLNAHPNLWSLGELHVLRHELEASRYPCGCGVEVDQCEFWGDLLPELPLNRAVNVDYFRESYGAGRVLRPSHFLDIIRGSVGKRNSADAERFCEVNSGVLRRIRDAAVRHAGRPIKFLVDASKDPYRLFWLQASDDIDVHVLHLTKDPRGFVYSNLKDQPRYPLRKAIRMSFRWLIQNLLMRRVGRLEDKYHLVRYEDLARKPTATVDEILSCLDLPPRRRGHFRKVENHAISGNTMRWENTSVYFDDVWTRELPSLYRRVSWIVAFPLARTLGYQRVPYWLDENGRDA